MDLDVMIGRVTSTTTDYSVHRIVERAAVIRVRRRRDDACGIDKGSWAPTLVEPMAAFACAALGEKRRRSPRGSLPNSSSDVRSSSLRRWASALASWRSGHELQAERLDLLLVAIFHGVQR